MTGSSALRPLRARLRAGARHAIDVLHDAPYGAQLINTGVQLLGSRFQEHFFLLAHQLPAPARELCWTVSREDYSFLLPVSRRWPLSWSVALSAHVHERGIQRFCRDFRARGDRARAIVDVGANHGLFSFPFMANGYPCVLFEPQPACLSYLREAVLYNRFEPPPALEAAVLAERLGSLTFFTSTSTFYSSLERDAVEQWESASELMVTAYRLDDYAAEHALVPALIKIDVEGGELRVLEGAREVLTRHRPTLVVELHAASGHRSDAYSLLHDELGYRVSALPDSLERTPLDREGFLASECANFAFVHDPSLHGLLR